MYLHKLIQILSLLLLSISSFSQQDSTIYINVDFEINEIYTFIDKGPNFKGGTDSLYLAIQANLAQDLKSKNENYTDFILIRLTIEKDGRISDWDYLTKEYNKKRNLLLLSIALNCLPNFSPGMQDNKFVRCYYTFPIYL